MAELVAGLATSHAFTFIEPSRWDEFREKNRASYARRYGAPPAAHPGVEQESLQANERRYERIRARLDGLRRALVERDVSALVLVGDDQDENFSDAILPQIAVYVGPDFQLVNRLSGARRPYPAHSALARAIVERGVADGFDIASLGSFPNRELLSHAHAQVLEAFAGESPVPVVLVFVNAIHHPSVEPARCYALGQMIARAVTAFEAGEGAPTERVAICGSGGLSHFTAGYPWRHYSGPYQYGSISEEFDRDCIELMRAGRGDKLAELSSGDLLQNGDIEMRAWITVLGAVGPTPADDVVYEPFYRGLMAMSVASWSPAGPVSARLP
jgi:hypothetical protein